MQTKNSWFLVQQIFITQFHDIPFEVQQFGVNILAVISVAFKYILLIMSYWKGFKGSRGMK